MTKGVERAPDRSLFYALGYTEEELGRPLIGVACFYNETVSDHMNLDKIAGAVKVDVRTAGGMLVESPAIAVCDGIAMGHISVKYSLVTRDLIVGSTEAMAITHQFDGLVMIPNYDKSVSDLLMAAARVNILTIFCSNDPMLTGRLEDGRCPCLSHMFEAIGTYKAGKLGEVGVEGCESNACPTYDSYSGMYTANSMNYLIETVGMGLRGSDTIPAVWSIRLRLVKHAGIQIMELVTKDICPWDIMTPVAFHNTETVDMALSYPTNTMLHLSAVVHECGIELDLDLLDGISSKIPNLCHLAPAGDTYMEDLEGAGGMHTVMRELTKKGLLDTSVFTCTRKTLAKNLEGVVNCNPELIHLIENPYSADDGIAMLKDNLAPEGCVMKRSAMAPETMFRISPARVFNSKEEAIETIYTGKIVPGDVAVIRYEGPKGGPGIREMPNSTSTVRGMGLGESVALITDGHFSGVTHGASIGHVCPEVAQGGPIGLVGEGDIISINIPACEVELQVNEATLAARHAKQTCSELKIKTSRLARYAELVISAARGVVLE